MKSNFEIGSELHLELSNLPIVRTFMILKKPYWVSLHTVKFGAFMNSMNDIYSIKLGAFMNSMNAAISVKLGAFIRSMNVMIFLKLRAFMNSMNARNFR